MSLVARLRAPCWWISTLAMLGLAACSGVHRTDSSEPYRIEQTNGIATLANSATVVLYNIDGKKIPETFEEFTTSSMLVKPYVNLVERQNAISPGFHCLLFQTTFNNELIQIPFLAQKGGEYQVIKYETPDHNPLIGFASLLLGGSGAAGVNYDGYLSIYETSKVAGIVFEPNHAELFDSWASSDRLFRKPSEEASFRDLFENSEITVLLDSGENHQAFFDHTVKTGLQLARKNIDDSDVDVCPPVRVVMPSGVAKSSLKYLKHPPVLEDRSPSTDPGDDVKRGQ